MSVDYVLLKDKNLALAPRQGPEINSRACLWVLLRPRHKRLRWSRGSVLPLNTQVRGFKSGRSRQDFSGRKNPRHAFLRKGSKAMGPLS